MEPQPFQQPSRIRGTAVAVLVVGGLVASIVAGVFLIAAPAQRVPGIALGLATILVAERIAALFATWLFALVIVVRALSGDLPTEISGRGLKYANAEASQEVKAGSKSALQELEDEMNALRGVVFEIQDTQRAHARQLGRYAMRDGCNGH